MLYGIHLLTFFAGTVVAHLVNCLVTTGRLRAWHQTQTVHQKRPIKMPSNDRYGEKVAICAHCAVHLTFLHTLFEFRLAHLILHWALTYNVDQIEDLHDFCTELVVLWFRHFLMGVWWVAIFRSEKVQDIRLRYLMLYHYMYYSCVFLDTVQRDSSDSFRYRATSI